MARPSLDLFDTASQDASTSSQISTVARRTKLGVKGKLELGRGRRNRQSRKKAKKEKAITA